MSERDVSSEDCITEVEHENDVIQEVEDILSNLCQITHTQYTFYASLLSISITCGKSKEICKHHPMKSPNLQQQGYRNDLFIHSLNKIHKSSSNV